MRAWGAISGGGRLSELCRFCFASPLIRAACTSKYREAKCGGEGKKNGRERCDQVQAPGGGEEEDGDGARRSSYEY